ncbi:MAG: hypothetical protein WDW36_002460 [Sanguina aurantia]
MGGLGLGRVRGGAELTPKGSAPAWQLFVGCGDKTILSLALTLHEERSPSITPAVSAQQQQRQQQPPQHQQQQQQQQQQVPVSKSERRHDDSSTHAPPSTRVLAGPSILGGPSLPIADVETAAAAGAPAAAAASAAAAAAAAAVAAAAAGAPAAAAASAAAAAAVATDGPTPLVRTGHPTSMWANITDQVLCIAHHPTATGLLAFGCADGTVGLFHTPSNASMAYPSRHQGPVLQLCWSGATPTPTTPATAPSSHPAPSPSPAAAAPATSAAAVPAPPASLAHSRASSGNSTSPAAPAAQDSTSSTINITACTSTNSSTSSSSSSSSCSSQAAQTVPKQQQPRQQKQPQQRDTAEPLGVLLASCDATRLLSVGGEGRLLSWPAPGVADFSKGAGGGSGVGSGGGGQRREFGQQQQQQQQQPRDLGHTILQLLPTDTAQRYSHLTSPGSWGCGAISTSPDTGVVAVASDAGDVFLLQPYGHVHGAGGGSDGGWGRGSDGGSGHDSSLRLLHCLDSEGPVRLLAWSRSRCPGAHGSISRLVAVRDKKSMTVWTFGAQQQQQHHQQHQHQHQHQQQLNTTAPSHQPSQPSQPHSRSTHQPHTHPQAPPAAMMQRPPHAATALPFDAKSISALAWISAEVLAVACHDGSIQLLRLPLPHLPQPSHSPPPLATSQPVDSPTQRDGALQSSMSSPPPDESQPDPSDSHPTMPHPTASSAACDEQLRRRHTSVQAAAAPTVLQPNDTPAPGGESYLQPAALQPKAAAAAAPADARCFPVGILKGHAGAPRSLACLDLDQNGGGRVLMVSGAEDQTVRSWILDPDGMLLPLPPAPPKQPAALSTAAAADAAADVAAGPAAVTIPIAEPAAAATGVELPTAAASGCGTQEAAAQDWSSPPPPLPEHAAPTTHSPTAPGTSDAATASGAAAPTSVTADNSCQPPPGSHVIPLPTVTPVAPAHAVSSSSSSSGQVGQPCPAVPERLGPVHARAVLPLFPPPEVDESLAVGGGASGAPVAAGSGSVVHAHTAVDPRVSLQALALAAPHITRNANPSPAPSTSASNLTAASAAAASAASSSGAKRASPFPGSIKLLPQSASALPAEARCFVCGTSAGVSIRRLPSACEPDAGVGSSIQ